MNAGDESEELKFVETDHSLRLEDVSDPMDAQAGGQGYGINQPASLGKMDQPAGQAAAQPQPNSLLFDPTATIKASSHVGVAISHVAFKLLAIGVYLFGGGFVAAAAAPPPPPLKLVAAYLFIEFGFFVYFIWSLNRSFDPRCLPNRCGDHADYWSASRGPMTDNLHSIPTYLSLSHTHTHTHNSRAVDRRQVSSCRTLFSSSSSACFS